MLKLQEVGCVLARNSVETSFQELFWNNINGYDDTLESEIAVIETLQNQVSKNIVQKCFGSYTGAVKRNNGADGRCRDNVEFWKREIYAVMWTSVLSLKIMPASSNNVISEEEDLRGSYDRRKFCN